LPRGSAEWLKIPYGVTNHGPEGYRKHWELWTTAAPGCEIAIVQLTPSPGVVVGEFIARGTHTGQLSTPKGQIPASDQKVELRLCDVIRISGGRAFGSRIYFDMLSLMRQIGHAPA
jgi:predicted ester cyclase